MASSELPRVFLSALLVIACSADSSRAFRGTGPRLSDCFVGYAFAECGGQGSPRLGCRVPEAEEAVVPVCMWFTGGLVAQGFVATGCEDLCCVGRNPGRWPYDIDDPLVGNLALDVAHFLYAWGLRPWDRERGAELEPELDADLEARSEPELLVSGAPLDVADAGFPRLVVTRVLRDTISIVVSHQTGFTSESWLLEVVKNVDGTSARVCRFLSTDSHALWCDVYEDAGAECATEATITLSQLPETEEELDVLAVRVEAELRDGTTLELSL